MTAAQKYIFRNNRGPKIASDFTSLQAHVISAQFSSSGVKKEVPAPPLFQKWWIRSFSEIINFYSQKHQFSSSTQNPHGDVILFPMVSEGPVHGGPLDGCQMWGSGTTFRVKKTTFRVENSTFSGRKQHFSGRKPPLFGVKKHHFSGQKTPFFGVENTTFWRSNHHFLGSKNTTFGVENTTFWGRKHHFLGRKQLKIQHFKGKSGGFPSQKVVHPPSSPR